MTGVFYFPGGGGGVKKNIGKMLTGLMKKQIFQCTYGSCPAVPHTFSHFLHFTVVVLGSPMCGKTSFIQRYVKGTFPQPRREETMGGHLTKHEKIVNGERVNFEIWELSGRDRFRPMVSMYLRSATAIILCYNPWDRFSMDHNKNLAKCITEYAQENAIISVIGMKADYDLEGQY